MTINLNKTITWLPPVNSNVTNFRTEFDRIYGNFSSVNDSFEDINPRLADLENDFVRTGQAVEADLPSNTPVYFDVSASEWRRFLPLMRNVVPALFLGSGAVALNGALVDITVSGNILYVSESGELAGSLSSAQVTRRYSLGYRVGSTLFKLDYKNHGSRMREFAQGFFSADIAGGDHFGSAVVIQGDRMLVGANYENNAVGAAYILKFNGHRWFQEAKLTASDGFVQHGYADNLAMDGNVVVVGAISDNGVRGAVYVYRYDGSVWNQEAKLTISGAAADDRFGYSVGVYGDVIVAGAYREGTMGDDGGAAYIFRYDGSTWNQEVKLTASDGVTSGGFGISCAIYEQVVVIGSSGAKTDGNLTGAAYVYSYDGSAWGDEVKLIGSSTEDIRLGYFVGIFQNRIVAGAYYDNEGASHAGAGYVFKYDGAAWNQEAKLMAHDPESEDQMGIAVAIHGETIVVGAPKKNYVGSTDTGAVYVYHYDGTQWNEDAKLISAGAIRSGFSFGSALSVYGDTVVVCEEGNDDYGSSTGKGYVYDLTEK